MRDVHETPRHCGHVRLEGIECDSSSPFRILHLRVNCRNGGKNNQKTPHTHTINPSVANRTELVFQNEGQLIGFGGTRHSSDEDLQNS